MDRWAWSQSEPWLAMRRQLPVGALLCVIRGATAGRHWQPSSARNWGAPQQRRACDDGSRRINSGMRTPSRWRTRACHWSLHSANTRTSGSHRSICRGSTARRSSTRSTRDRPRDPGGSWPSVRRTQMRVRREEQGPVVDRLSHPTGSGAQEGGPLDSGNDEEEPHRLSADVMVHARSERQPAEPHLRGHRMNRLETDDFSAGRRSKDPMTPTTCHMSISLDGFVAGPDQSRENPLGIGGLQLHHWHLDEPLHEADARARNELMRRRGAYVMGRNMFGPIRGRWDGEWRGWWGDEPPYHAPVFVLTHYPHEPIEMNGGTTFHFVTEGFDAAFERATAAADGLGVDIAGGASTVRQALAASVIDELMLDIVPVLLGTGERLFDRVEDPGFEPLEIIHSPHATHVRYRVGG